MTKKEIALQIAEELTCTQKLSQDIIQRFLDILTEQLASGKTVELRNFGIFSIKEFKERIGRNPKKPTETVVIPKRHVVSFASGKYLKNRVNDIPFED